MESLIKIFLMIKVVSVCWLKIVTNSLTLLPRRKMVFVSFPWTCAGSLPTLTIEYSRSHTLLSCRVPLINCHLFKQPLLKPSFCALRKLNKPYREAPSERKKGPWANSPGWAQATSHTILPVMWVSHLENEPSCPS